MPEEVVPEAPETDTPAEAEPEKPIAPPAPPKYKLGDEEYDEASLKKLVADAKKADEAFKRAKEIEKGGRTKLEEASALRKQFSQIRDVVLENPTAGLLEMAKIFGLPEDTIDRIFAQRAQLQQQWEKMSDDQKARYLAEQKAHQLETEKKDREAVDAQAKQATEVRAKQDAFEKKLANDTIPIMQEAGLHPSHLKLKLVAATLGAIADRDGPETEPDISEAVAYVAEAYSKDLDDSVKAMDPAAFVARYPELAAKLREFEVARATGKAPGMSGKPPAPRAEPPGTDKQESWSDFSKRMRALQRGQRI